MSSSDDSTFPDDLPEIPEKTEAYLHGFYHGFSAVRGTNRPDRDAINDAAAGWFYTGYVTGWVTKVAILVFIGTTAIPQSITIGAGAVAAVVAAVHGMVAAVFRLAV